MSDKREDYISWDEYFMAVAQLAGMRSKDPHTQGLGDAGDRIFGTK